jgi:hypothetical protein
MKPFKPCALILTALSLLSTACNPTVFTGGRDMDAAITAATVRRIEVGMQRAQVIQILGPPKAERAENYFGVGGEHHGVLLEYSQPVPWARWYPMLWVHLEGDSVVDVYAKRYDWIDDEGVYGWSASKRWEKTDLFEATFGK